MDRIETLEFDEKTYVSAVDRISEFRTNKDSYYNWSMICDFIGFKEIDGVTYAHFNSIISNEDEKIISTANYFRPIRSKDDFQIAETMCNSRALANAGVKIGASIASEDEINDMDGLFPQSPKADPKIEATLQATLESGRVK